MWNKSVRSNKEPSQPLKLQNTKSHWRKVKQYQEILRDRIFPCTHAILKNRDLTLIWVWVWEGSGNNLTTTPHHCWLPTFTSITRPRFQILGKTQTVVFPISGFLVNSLGKEFFVIPEKPVMILTWNLDQQLNLTRAIN